MTAAPAPPAPDVPSVAEMDSQSPHSSVTAAAALVPASTTLLSWPGAGLGAALPLPALPLLYYWPGQPASLQYMWPLPITYHHYNKNVP